MRRVYKVNYNEVLRFDDSDAENSVGDTRQTLSVLADDALDAVSKVRTSLLESERVAQGSEGESYPARVGDLMINWIHEGDFIDLV